MSKKYACGHNEDGQFYGEYNSRDEAIADISVDKGDNFYTGEITTITGIDLSSNFDLIGIIQDEAYESAGDASEDWNCILQDHKQKLERLVSETVGDYIDQNCPVDFSTVDNIEEHVQK